MNTAEKHYDELTEALKELPPTEIYATWLQALKNLPTKQAIMMSGVFIVVGFFKTSELAGHLYGPPYKPYKLSKIKNLFRKTTEAFVEDSKWTNKIG